MRFKSLILVVCCIFVTGCCMSSLDSDDASITENGTDILDSGKLAEGNLKESTFVTNDNADVQMVILSDKSDSEKIVAQISNESVEDLMFGEWYVIEKYQNGLWYEMDAKHVIDFNSVGYPLSKDQSMELSFIYDSQYELEAFQRYRVVTSYTDAKKNTHYISAEFEIGVKE